MKNRSPSRAENTCILCFIAIIQHSSNFTICFSTICKGWVLHQLPFIYARNGYCMSCHYYKYFILELRSRGWGGGAVKTQSLESFSRYLYCPLKFSLQSNLMPTFSHLNYIYNNQINMHTSTNTLKTLRSHKSTVPTRKSTTIRMNTMSNAQNKINIDKAGKFKSFQKHHRPFETREEAKS